MKDVFMTESGICPKCGSENLDFYDNHILTDDMMSYSFRCEDCNAEGLEFYNIVYHSSTLKIE